MADIVLTIPNDQIDRAVDALCVAGGYSGEPGDQRQRREFARGVLMQHLRQTVLDVERRQAMTDAMSGVTVDPITVE